MQPRRPVAEEGGQEDEDGHIALQFDEPLSWRPGRPIGTDKLLKRLAKLLEELGELDQDTVIKSSLAKIAHDVTSHQLLAHKDKGVRAYAICCAVDILMLCVPDAPFNSSELKDVFSLIVKQIIPALFEPSNTYNTQHKYVLRALCDSNSIVLLPDVDGSDALMVNLFQVVFDGLGAMRSSPEEQVGKEVELNLQMLLGGLIDDANSLPPQVVDCILAQFLRAAPAGGSKDRQEQVPVDESQSTLLMKEEPEPYQMAKNLCQQFPDKMARFVSQYFAEVIMDVSNLSGKAKDEEDDEAEKAHNADNHAGPSESDLKELRKAHILIREVWKAAPTILQNVVPQVEMQLSADNVHLRQLATETLGDMISGIGAAGPPPPPNLNPAAYPPIMLGDDSAQDSWTMNVLTQPLSSVSFPQTHPTTFASFLSRQKDKAGSIRATWATAAGYILCTSGGGLGLSREEDGLLISGLDGKLIDHDEKVRLAAVRAMGSFSFRDVILMLAPHGGVSKEPSLLCTLGDRCRDKKPAVRVAAMCLLANLWAAASGELLAGNEVVTRALSGVPSRILNAFYANELDLNILIYRVLYECLVPISYPPSKKMAKNGVSNGNSRSHPLPANSVDEDAVRVERILLLVRSLDDNARKAFYAIQARQPQFAKTLNTFINQCDRYNGGVMDSDAEKIKADLDKVIKWFAKFLPQDPRYQNDLWKFATFNDRRNYHLIRYIIGQEHEFKTVQKGFKELIKRIQAGKDASILDSLLPLLYLSGCLMFTRSYLSVILNYSKTNKDGLGTVAQGALQEISSWNPELFKMHIVQLCDDLMDNAPSATKKNDPLMAENLKACATFAQKYPDDVPLQKKLIQTMTKYALYGQPVRAAKYAVNVLTCRQNEGSLVSATNLLQQAIKDWEYGSSHFLNKLSIVCQLALVAPQVTDEAEKSILGMVVQQILLNVRTEASDTDPEWLDDAEMDQEIYAKHLALKILANRLRTIAPEAAKEKSKPVWSLLRKVISNKGEISQTGNTPQHHRNRLLLLGARAWLKLCQEKHFDDLLTPQDFDMLALVAQSPIPEVRHGFLGALQKYLADSKLRARYYSIVFLAAYEPQEEVKQRLETWIRSRAKHFQDLEQKTMEAVLPRLLSLLAHHPDLDMDDLKSHARYLVFYLNLVGTESNLGLIHKYAERVKQTQDALEPKSDKHRVMSDLAQAVIRKFQERKNWVFEAYAEKVGLPVGLYLPLPSHADAQQAAEEQYIPDGLDHQIASIIRSLDRKRKRKLTEPSHAGHDGQPPPKRTKCQAKEKRTKEEWHPKTKATTTKPDRRRSGRSRARKSYIERGDAEDDEEMELGIDDGDDGDDDDGDDNDGDDDDDADEESTGGEDEEASADESAGNTTANESEASAHVPETQPPGRKMDGRKTVTAKAQTGSGHSGSELSDPSGVAVASDVSELSELSDLDGMDIDREEATERADTEASQPSPPAPPPPEKTKNGPKGRKGRKAGAAPLAPAAALSKSMRGEILVATGKARPAMSAEGRSTRSRRKTGRSDKEE